MWAECMHVCVCVCDAHVRCEQRCYCCATVVVFVLSAGKRNKRSVRLDSRFCPWDDSFANTCWYQYLFIYPHKSRLTICVDTYLCPHKHTRPRLPAQSFLDCSFQEKPTKCQHFQHCGFGVMNKRRSVVNSSYFNILLYKINYTVHQVRIFKPALTLVLWIILSVFI